MSLSDYQTLIHASRYARYLDSEERRETWPETCKRYTDFWKDKEMITDAEAKKFTKAIEDMAVMPSARCLWTAGPALERDNAAGFNCTYAAVDHIRAFDEAFYLLMCGAATASLSSVSTSASCQRCQRIWSPVTPSLSWPIQSRAGRQRYVS